MPLATAATGIGKQVVTYAARTCLRALLQDALTADHMERANLNYPCSLSGRDRRRTGR